MIACAALETKKIELSTGIINPYTRNPVLVAETIATLNELSNGRTRLALGTGVQPLVEAMGIEFRRPLRAMSEAVEIIRKLLEGEKLNYSGQVYSVKDVKLGENPYFALVKTNFKITPVPIYVAAIGPKMLEVAGRVADGVLFTAGFAVENVNQAIPKVAEGARKSGKSIKDVGIGAYIVSNIGSASSALKGFLAFDVAYARPENLISIGVPEKKVTGIRDAVLKKGMQAGADLVSEDIIDMFAACGTKGEIQSKLEKFRAAGVTEPILLPMGGDPAALIRSMG
jgi:5,10-methylenetetrahydromethanopterin reductase